MVLIDPSLDPIPSLGITVVFLRCTCKYFVNIWALSTSCLMLMLRPYSGDDVLPLHETAQVCIERHWRYSYRIWLNVVHSGV